MQNQRSIPIPALLGISFIEGGAVMVIELLGAKIIAPYYGASLYVWSSVLGVTLGALASGYYLGGYVSRKYPGERPLFLVLLVGAFFAAIAPLIAPYILAFTDPLGVRLGSLVSVFLYLLPPVVCMGMVSPLVIQLINERKEDAGKSAGTVYAISTVGGILATFLAGFFMIPTLGIRLTSFITGGILGALALTYFFMMKKNSLALTVIILVLITALVSPSREQSEFANILHSSAGILGQWTVVDVGPWRLPEGTAPIERKLLLNGIDQTYTQRGFEPLSLWKYPHKLGAYSSLKPSGSKALLLGMGGGSIVYELLGMGHEVDVVELDERLKYIAETFFKFDPEKSNLFFDDARHFLRHTNKKYDIVLADMVHGEVQPSHFFTLEGMEELKAIMKEDGIFIINYQGEIHHPEYSRASTSLYKTLEESGFYVNYYSAPSATSGKQKYNPGSDLFFIASLKPVDYKKEMENLRYNTWFPYESFGYENLISEEPVDLSQAVVLTDDKPRLELLNADAILHWRKIKMEQNGKIFVKTGVPLFY
jgi:spermidine synthase